MAPSGNTHNPLGVLMAALSTADREESSGVSREETPVGSEAAFPCSDAGPSAEHVATSRVCVSGQGVAARPP